jgi:predicted methyltransferase
METFPFKKYQIEKSDLVKKFKYAQKNNHVSVATNNVTGQKLKYFMGLIILENKTIIRMSDFSDYFQEKYRLSAKLWGQPCSPIDYWLQEKETNGIELTKPQLFKKVKQCTSFSPTIMRGLIKMFKPKTILDPCAGWGDRLVTAILDENKINKYIGIDPNKSLHKGYQKIIKTYAKTEYYPKYELICGCAEDIVSKLDETFDMVFTSPPYFDLEIYEEDNVNSSTNKFPTFDSWFDNFLVKMIVDCSTKLSKDGVICININDIPNHNIIEPLIQKINELTDLSFQGIIYFGDPQCKSYLYQPILVWNKAD